MKYDFSSEELEKLALAKPGFKWLRRAYKGVRPTKAFRYGVPTAVGTAGLGGLGYATRKKWTPSVKKQLATLQKKLPWTSRFKTKIPKGPKRNAIVINRNSNIITWYTFQGGPIIEGPISVMRNILNTGKYNKKQGLILLLQNLKIGIVKKTGVVK